LLFILTLCCRSRCSPIRATRPREITLGFSSTVTTSAPSASFVGPFGPTMARIRQLRPACVF